jgi:hypothetical protein
MHVRERVSIGRVRDTIVESLAPGLLRLSLSLRSNARLLEPRRLEPLLRFTASQPRAAPDSSVVSLTQRSSRRFRRDSPHIGRYRALIPNHNSLCCAGLVSSSTDGLRILHVA